MRTELLFRGASIEEFDSGGDGFTGLLRGTERIEVKEVKRGRIYEKVDG